MLTNGWVLIAVSLGYLSLLFVIAHWGDRRVATHGAPLRRPVVWPLALTVHCTTWSLYGTTSQTISTGWIFPPTYIGAILLFVFGGWMVRKLILVSQQNNITSIADFISSRYGKSQRLAVLATLVAALCAVPYIALQLKGVAESLNLMVAHGDGTAPTGIADSGLIVALAMAAFSALFGARKAVSTEHNHGLMLALAFEAVFKLVAFCAIAAFAIWGVYRGPGDLLEAFANAAPFSSGQADAPVAGGFFASAVLGALSMICLPRLFHIVAVENADARDVWAARRLFVGYLLLMGAAVWPIAAAGAMRLPDAGAAGYHALTLPLSQNAQALAGLAFLGGLSAATSMVIAATVALGIMIANNVIMPIALHGRAFSQERGADLSNMVRLIRQASIVLLLALAYGYYKALGDAERLSSIGLLSMALAAQFAPAIIGGLYWPRGNARGAMAGLIAGTGVWGYTLFLPSIVRAGRLSDAIVSNGLFGLDWLRPTALFGFDGLDMIAQGVFWSLAANALAYVAFSLSRDRRVADRIQASAFTEMRADTAAADDRLSIAVGDLVAVSGRFVGARTAHEAFARFLSKRADSAVRQDPGDAASPATLAFAERLIAGAIGSASARVVLRSAAHGRVEMGDVVSIADEASKVFRYNRDLLQASMDNVSTAISVVDQNLRLVAWNRAYARLFSYPDGFLYPGRHVRDLIEYNAAQGRFGDIAPAEEVEKRISHLRAATPYTFLRERADGTFLDIRGNPMPGGGFVTSYTDVTALKRIAEALKEANELLEARVRERTRELVSANTELMRAKAEAERADQSKTRFFAAVSHDVLQPLNAARLFSTALSQKNADPSISPLIGHLDGALNAVQDLLSEVLDISKLDAGGVEPEIADIPLGPLLTELAAEFAPMAAEKGVALSVQASSIVVRSDRHYLRRIVQNFLSNAVRYTDQGRILLGVRRKDGAAQIEVWDTGAGIPEHEIPHIFSEFKQVGGSSGARCGLGLGLAIVRRIGRMLDHPIDVRSAPGHGSVFSVAAPMSEKRTLQHTASPFLPPAHDFSGARVLCIDNDAAILTGMRALLEGWGCEIFCAHSLNEAAAFGALGANPPDLILADYHLDHGEDGLSAVQALRRRWRAEVPCILISADRTTDLRARALEAGCQFLPKPVRPAALRALMSRVRPRTATRAIS